MQQQFYKDAISATNSRYISDFSEVLGINSNVIESFVRDYLQEG